MNNANSDNPAPTHGVVIRLFRVPVRIIAVPVLVLLYVGAAIPLSMRNCFHHLTRLADWMFDRVAWCAGWDCRFWPLPKASDEPVHGHEGPTQ